MKQKLADNRMMIAIVAAVLLIGAAFWYVSANTAPSFGATTVKKGNVVEAVSESGNVLAENSVALSFQGAGQVEHVYVKEGDQVSAGQPLADLDVAQFSAAADQANAALAAAQARLDELQSGTRSEELRIDQTAVANASAALGASLLSAYSAADDAVRNQTDNFFQNPQTNNPIFTIPVIDSQITANIQSARVRLGGTLATFYATISATSSDPATVSPVADSALREVSGYLNSVALAVNAATTNLGISATTLAAYRANVVTARTEVTAAVSALTTAEANLANAKNTLALAQAGATPQELEAQKAAVLQAQAAASGAAVALDHASLRAPFAGVVQGLNLKLGQVVTPGVPVVSVVNNGGLKIEVFVSEADIAKIKEGSPATVTLDAFGTGTNFPATVTTIDSSKTTLNGTSAYKVTLHFTNADSRPKDGMTANVNMLVAEHDNVLEVPTRLIVSDGDAHFVLVSSNGVTERREISTGLTGDDGMTEVTAGLAEGDQIINF